MSKEIDELIRDLSGIGFIKSSVRKRVEQFVSEYKKRIIQIGEGMRYYYKKPPKSANADRIESAYDQALLDYQKKIEKA